MLLTFKIFFIFITKFSILLGKIIKYVFFKNIFNELVSDIVTFFLNLGTTENRIHINSLVIYYILYSLHI